MVCDSVAGDIGYQCVHFPLRRDDRRRERPPVMAEAVHPGARSGHESRRVLIVSASMGAGHDTVARELARRARDRGHEAHIVDVLGLLPYGLGAGLRVGYRSSVRHFPWAYGAVYRLLLRRGAGCRPSGVPLARLAGTRLAELAARTRADVVVPVFHLGAQLTGHLRSQGRLRVPSVVFLIDFAVHRQWLHPGNDRYLCLTDEAAAEVRQDIHTPAEAIGPMVAPEFFMPGRTTALWTQRFDRYAPGRPPVLLSAGAWGTGTRLSATARLLAGHGFLPVVLCGRNERLRAGLGGSGRSGAGLDRRHDRFDACVRRTGRQRGRPDGRASPRRGTSRGGYRPLPGHGAEGVHRMAALGVSDLAVDETGLLASLGRLAPGGPVRERHVAQARSLFRGTS